MAIELISITSDQAEYILNLDEGHFLDLKSQDVSPAKLTKTISAFSNADGGELFIGISMFESLTTELRSRIQAVSLPTSHQKTFLMNVSPEILQSFA
jgi:predicted HTH transcriptional regulator